MCSSTNHARKWANASYPSFKIPLILYTISSFSYNNGFMTTLIKDSEKRQERESANKLLMFLTFSFNLHLEHPGSGPLAIKNKLLASTL